MMTGKIQLHTVFRWCNDVDAMRRFYSDLLGLEETFYRNDDKHGWLTYQAGTQIVFMRGTNPIDIPLEWAKQPGFSGGDVEIDSWLLTFTKADFEVLKQRITNADIEQLTGAGIDSSRQIIVHDPMGITVELSIEPD
jgi:catechol 2,3-dioxygenase-like lactoylglutathione lyase family enzyme